MLGGSSALVSLTFSMATLTRRPEPSGRRRRENPLASPWRERGDRGDRRQQVGRRRAADALDPLGKGQIAAVVSRRTHVAHDRIAGHLEKRGSDPQHKDAGQGECGLVGLVGLNGRDASAAAFSPRPRSNKFFLPIRAASRPPGTLKTANAPKTTNVGKVEVTSFKW